MKKLFCLLFFLIPLFVFVGCGERDYSVYVSQLRASLYEGESESFYIKAFPEVREYPLKADGFVGDKADFIVLKITFKSGEKQLINDLSAHFSTDKDYEASAPYKPDVESYVATVKVNELPDSERLTVTVTAGDKKENVELVKAKNGAVSADKALKAACAHKSEQLETLSKQNADFEIMIRLIAESGNYYYYVGITETEYTTALLIDDKGEIIAEKRIKNQ